MKDLKALTKLRWQAEKRIRGRTSDVSRMSTGDIAALVHELEVHQVELEIQNEELRQTQVELQTARDLYQNLYEFAPAGYFTLEARSYRIMEVNLEGSRLLGVNRTDLQKTVFTRYVDPEYADTFYFCQKRAYEKLAQETCEIKLNRGDKSVFWARLEILVLDKSQIRMSVFDITEQKQAEQKLNQRTLDLETANRELEAFSYSVSHDLRAPLRTLDGFSQAVIEDYADRLDEKGKDYLMRVRNASQTMAKLIDEMLKLSRISRADMHRDKVNLSVMVQSILTELKEYQPERQVELSIASNIEVNGDKQLLTIAIRNLLENAWKFTGKCMLARIEAGRVCRQGEDIYYIKDNGAGFDMQYADKLFQPFQRLHSKNEFPGIGIGLAIVQRIIRRHGGRIWAEGEIGKGAVFYFTLG